MYSSSFVCCLFNNLVIWSICWKHCLIWTNFVMTTWTIPLFVAYTLSCYTPSFSFFHAIKKSACGLVAQSVCHGYWRWWVRSPPQDTRHLNGYTRPTSPELGALQGMTFGISTANHAKPNIRSGDMNRLSPEGINCSRLRREAKLEGL